MDDRTVGRRRFLGRVAAAFVGLAAAPMIPAPAEAAPRGGRRGWGWTRWARAPFRGYGARNNGYGYNGSGYGTGAPVDRRGYAPRGYVAPAPRRYYYRPAPAGSGWGGGRGGYIPPMM